MCSTDKTAPLRLPLRLVLILAICTCALAVHFVVEGLAPVSGAPGFDLAVQGGHAHLVHEHCEDNFIFPFLTRLPVDYPAVSIHFLAATVASSFSVSPLLPPPNS